MNGAAYLATTLPWLQLREMANDPGTPDRTRPALLQAMAYQERVRGVMPHREQVHSFGQLSKTEIEELLPSLVEGPVREAATEVIVGYELARTAFSEEAMEIAVGQQCPGS